MSKKPRLAEGARRGGFTAEEIVARVRKYYDMGKRLLEQSAKGGANRSNRDPTAVSGPSRASIRAYKYEYRRFAETYTSVELEGLLKLFSSERGNPAGWGIVRKLMAVPDKARRRQLELRAAKEGWSVRQTAAIIRQTVVNTKQARGGRPLTAPKNLTELLYRVEMHAGESRRRFLQWTGSDLLQQAPLTTKVSKSLRARVLAIRDELKIVAREAKVLSQKLELLMADGPEFGEKPRAKAVTDRSTRTPT